MDNPKSEQAIPDSSRLARSKRVQNLRVLTGLSRRAFTVKYQLPNSTMQNWEDLKGNGLTESGAHKLANIFKAEGIYCSAEWLLHGIGEVPQFSERHIQNDTDITGTATITADEEAKLVGEELRLFHQHFPEDAIDLLVTDDAMSPHYINGESVAGVRCTGHTIEKLIGMDCIVQLESGEVMLRTLKKGSMPKRYTLICANPDVSIANPIIHDAELISAAPVIWVRRKLSKLNL